MEDKGNISLFSKLGDETALENIANSFLRKILADIELKHLFDTVDIMEFRTTYVLYIKIALGGPFKDDGNQMNKIRSHLSEKGLNTIHQKTITKYFNEALEELKFSKAIIEEIKKIDLSILNDIDYTKNKKDMALGKNLKPGYTENKKVPETSKKNPKKISEESGSIINKLEIEINHLSNERKLDMVKNNVIDLACIVSMTDRKGFITYVNDLFCEVAGYTREECLGQNQNMVRHPNTPKAVFKDLWQTVGSGKVWRGDIENKCKDGSSYFVDALISPVIGDNGKPESYIGIRYEKTEQVLALREAKAIEDAVDTGWSSIQFTPEGTIIKANKNFTDTVGYSSESDLVGQHHRIFCEDDYASSSDYKKFWQDLAAGITLTGEFKRVKKDGGDIWLNASYTPVKDEQGRVVKVIKIANNIDIMVQDRIAAESIKSAVDTGWASIDFEPDGTILNANKNFLSTLGYGSEKEIQGQHHRMFCDRDYAASPEYQRFWLDLANGISQTADFNRIKKDGNHIWLKASYTPVKDIDGNVFKIIKIAANINAQKLAEIEGQLVIEELNRVVTIVNSKGDLNVRLAMTGISDMNAKVVNGVNALLNDVANPIMEIKRLVSELAEGNLVNNYELESKGDLKDLGDAYNAAIDNLNVLMQNLTEVAILVGSSSEELLTMSDQMEGTTQEVASAIQQMAEGAHQQAQQTDETSKLVAEVMKTSNNMSAKADLINTAAQAGQMSTTEGLTTVRKVVENMAEIEDSAKQTSESIDVLTERSEEIARTLNVITDIAAQTNLLALNAAIEAARAGEAGRGFAVVAEEIRKLAEGSRKSAVDIQRVITAVQKDITQAGKAITNMGTSVKSGSKASKEAQEVFGAIGQVTGETFELSEEIKSASDVQKESIDETVKNIEKIVVVAEETAAGSEQIATSSKELSLGMAEVNSTSNQLAAAAVQLNEGVAKFILKK